MRFTIFVGNNEVERLADSLIDGIAKHRCRAATPVANYAESIGEDYDISIHVVTFEASVSAKPIRLRHHVAGSRRRFGDEPSSSPILRSDWRSQD
jgi:hypothetical protein